MYMSKFRAFWNPWGKVILGLLLLGVMVAWATGAFRRMPPAGEAVATGFPLEPGVPTATVTPTTIAPPLDVIGTIVSDHRVQVASRLSAFVRAVPVGPGQTVREGDLLVELDDRDIQEQLLAVEAQRQQAETEWARAQRLAAQQATTEQALQAAETAFQAARAQVERVRALLAYTRLTAPMDGIVTDTHVKAGDLANPGQTLLTVFDPLQLRLEVAVPMRLLERLTMGQSVTVALEGPAGTVTGTVAEIVGEIDPRSRTQLVKVRLPAGLAGAVPGAFGRLWVSDSPRSALLLPVSAIHRVGQLQQVHRVQGDRVQRRAVQTGMILDGSIEIVAGLAPGDVVLMHPLAGPP